MAEENKIYDSEDELSEEAIKAKKKKERRNTKNLAYDLQEEFKPKQYDLEQLVDYWKKQAGITNAEPAVEGDAIDVTLESGTSIKDKGSSMTMSGKDGQTPQPEDFDKIVKASLDRGWRAVAIGPNCSDEFKANLYLACAKNGVDCLLNGYNPPEELKSLAKQLYAQAKGQTAEQEQQKTAQDKEGGMIYNPSEKEMQNKQTPEAKKQEAPETAKDVPAEYKESFAKIENLAGEFLKNNKRKFDGDIAKLRDKQFAVWKNEFAEIKTALEANPEKKLSAREKKIVKNSFKYGYDKAENNSFPKDVKIVAKDFDKALAGEYGNFKKSLTLNKVAIDALTSSLKLSIVDNKNPNFGKLDVDKDLNKETFKNAVMHTINTAVASEKGQEPGKVEVRHIVKAIDKLSMQTKLQNKAIKNIINPAQAKAATKTVAKAATKTVAKAAAKTTTKAAPKKDATKEAIAKKQTQR
ncbi:MAG: hypothetical protein AB7U85_06970 [Alphaproteobacteria bacterium]